jgi:hypothetical protein
VRTVVSLVLNTLEKFHPKGRGAIIADKRATVTGVMKEVGEIFSHRAQCHDRQCVQDHGKLQMRSFNVRELRLEGSDSPPHSRDPHLVALTTQGAALGYRWDFIIALDDADVSQFACRLSPGGEIIRGIT